MAIMTMSTGNTVQAVALSIDNQITSGATTKEDDGLSNANCKMHKTQATVVAKPASRSEPKR
jgi:hypothetical protein